MWYFFFVDDSSGKSCQVTCLENSCEVRTGGTMGSCFLPPFEGGCSGLPKGCGSCIDECSSKRTEKGKCEVVYLRKEEKSQHIFECHNLLNVRNG